MSILFGCWSIARSLRPDLSDSSRLTEHASAGDQRLKSFGDTDTFFAAKLVALMNQPD